MRLCINPTLRAFLGRRAGLRPAGASAGEGRAVSAIEVSGLQEELRLLPGAARDRLPPRGGRGVRAARAQRGGKDHHRRDPRGLPQARRRRGAGAGRRPGPGRAGVPGPDRHRAPVLRGLPDPLRPGDPRPVRGLLPASPRPVRGDRARGPRGEAPTRAFARSRAGSSAGSTSALRSSATRSSSSSTSRRPASIPRRDARPGRRFAASERSARASC